MTPRRERMAPGDAAWLHMDRRTNRLVVDAVMWFDEPLDPVAVRALVLTRLADRHPRFRQRVVEQGPLVYWQDDEEFRVERHLVRARLPEPGGERELHDYVSARAGEPLRRDRPLWEVHVVENYGEHGSALVIRVHHCVADGVALSRLMLSLTDDASYPLRPVAPEPAGRRMGARALDAVSAARAAARLTALPPDARTSLRGELGETKAITWSAPLRLDEVKAAARAHEVTVNDLLLAAIAGALRSHLARTDGRAPDVRAVVPVDLRRPDDGELGNRFGLMFVQLPVSVDDTQRRLAETHRRTSALKHSAEPVVAYRLLDVVGRVPYAGEQLFVELFSAKASAVITNVRGPAQPVFLAGRQVRGTVAWPPESGRLGTGFSIISYDGHLVVGLMTDARRVPRPDLVLDDVCAELDALVAAAPADAVGADGAGAQAAGAPDVEHLTPTS